MARAWRNVMGIAGLTGTNAMANQRELIVARGIEPQVHMYICFIESQSS